MNGGNTKVYVANPSQGIQSQVLFYDSGTLPDGRHTLVLTNLVELDFLWIDYFLITAGSNSATIVPVQSAVQTTTEAVSGANQFSTQVTVSTIAGPSSIESSVVIFTQIVKVQNDGASNLLVILPKSRVTLIGYTSLRRLQILQMSPTAIPAQSQARLQPLWEV